MTRPSTPIRDAVWPLELTAAKLAGESPDRVAAVRWRDAEGQEGQSSVGEIAHQIADGREVRVAGIAAEIAEDGANRWLVVGGRLDPLLALPSW
jgi:hypothetical protein